MPGVCQCLGGHEETGRADVSEVSGGRLEPARYSDTLLTKSHMSVDSQLYRCFLSLHVIFLHLRRRPHIADARQWDVHRYQVWCEVSFIPDNPTGIRVRLGETGLVGIWDLFIDNSSLYFTSPLLPEPAGLSSK